MSIFFLETAHIEKCSVITGKDGIYQYILVTVTSWFYLSFSFQANPQNDFLPKGLELFQI